MDCHITGAQLSWAGYGSSTRALEAPVITFALLQHFPKGTLPPQKHRLGLQMSAGISFLGKYCETFRRIGLGSNSPVSSFFSLIQRATSSFHLANSKQYLLVYQLYMTLSDFINFHKPFHNLYRAYAEACIIRRGMSQSLHNDSTSIRVELVEWLAHHIFDFLPFISFMTSSYYQYTYIISHDFIFHICPFLLAIRSLRKEQSQFSIIYKIRVSSSKWRLGQLSLSLSHHHP